MKKILNYIFISIFAMFIGITAINASVAYSKLNGYVQYNANGYVYNGYSSSNPGGYYTIYKELCNNNNVQSSCSGKTLAYCSENAKVTPNNNTKMQSVDYGTTYAGKLWDYRKAARVGYIIKTINDNSKYNQYEKYLYSYFAINSFLGFSSNSFSNNNYIKTIVNNANNYSVCIPTNGSKDSSYDTINTYVTELKATNFKYSDTDSKYSSTVSFKLKEKDGCGSTITYKYKIEKNNTQIESGNITSKETSKTISIDGSNVDKGDKIKFTITASSSKTYYVSKLWKPVDSNGNYISNMQSLITTTEGAEYKKSGAKSIDLTIPTDQKTIEILKKDEKGNSLDGANITLTVYDNNKAEIGNCTTSGNSSCKVLINDSYTTNTYYISWSETTAPSGYKKLSGVEMQQVVFEGSNKYITINVENNPNTLSVSKQDINGNEIEGASLKICSESSYSSSGNNCTAAKTIEEKEMSWISDKTTKVWYGIPAGTYYLVETIAAPGYHLSNTSAVKFIMKDDGTVENVQDNTLVIKNEINKITISKTDMASSKELPGAKLTICKAFKNEETGKYEAVKNDFNVCEPVSLADNSSATWTSSDSPKIIEGLIPGTYYLTEETAPKGYTEAESILFVMNEDGSLSDIDGNSLANNKLVMKDDVIPPTGAGKYIIIILILVAVSIGIYYLLGKNYVLEKMYK